MGTAASAATTAASGRRPAPRIGAARSQRYLIGTIGLFASPRRCRTRAPSDAIAPPTIHGTLDFFGRPIVAAGPIEPVVLLR